jgi:hypothetical protein
MLSYFHVCYLFLTLSNVFDEFDLDDFIADLLSFKGDTLNPWALVCFLFNLTWPGFCELTLELDLLFPIGGP